jgi:hypothetical protein
MSSAYIRDDSSRPLSLPRTTKVALALPWGATGRIVVSWPDDVAGRDGHPLLVLLGGERQFGLARDLAYLLGRDGAKSTGAGVVAAIELDDDDGFELGWTAAAGAASGTALAGAITAAIVSELVDRAPVDRSRVSAVGFGAAGRLIVEGLIAAPETFAVTVAANPSVWPGGPPAIDGERLRNRIAALPPRHLLILAEGKRSRMAANARTIATRFTEARVAALSVTLSLVDEDDPIALVPTAISRAIRLAFAPPRHTGGAGNAPS